MRIGTTTARLFGASLLVGALLVPATTYGLSAQDTTRAADTTQAAGSQAEAASTVDQEEMLHFVELQLEIDQLQEEAIQEMVRIHAVDGRAQIRNNLTEAIAAAHEEHGMTPERYKTITFLISSDTAVRELFEATMAEVQEEGGGA